MIATRSLYRRLHTDSQIGRNVKVIHSLSNCVYTNLALEDHLFLAHDCLNSEILLFYVNTPSVVIGRNQVLWKECSTTNCVSQGVNLVRRKSGGGAVYHDLGNLNISLITSRETFNKGRLSELIRDTVNAGLFEAKDNTSGVRLCMSERHDLFLGSFKVSGSAYKVGAKNAYHHCTLLVNSDLSNVSDFLQPEKAGIRTRAIESVRSKVTNISNNSAAGGVSLSWISSMISKGYCNSAECVSESFIDPAENYELSGKAEELKSIQWIYNTGASFFVVPDKVHLMGVHSGGLRVLIEHGFVKAVYLGPSSINYEQLADYLTILFCGRSYANPNSSPLSDGTFHTHPLPVLPFIQPNHLVAFVHQLAQQLF